MIGLEVDPEVRMDSENNINTTHNVADLVTGSEGTSIKVEGEMIADSKTGDTTNTADQINSSSSTENRTNMDTNAAREIAILEVSRNPAKRQAFISDQRVRAIQMLASKVKKTSKGINQSVPELPPLVNKVETFLTWLELDVQMTPQVKERTKIDQGLKLIFDDPRFEFPTEMKEQAQTLYERWEAENWGANEVEDEDLADESDNENDRREDGPPQAKRRRPNAPSADDFGKLNTIRLPPANHPIWGVDGMMHGLAVQKGQRRQYVIDPRYIRSKRNPKVFGNNGFKNGAWFPFQSVALFRGCHGAPMAGIAGNRDEGAWSVVTSGAYEDLDKDLGDVLYYSGSGSHENKDPGTPAASTSGTMALHASLRSGQPVRVLRAAKKAGRYAPTCGIRYDGLYTIVEVRYPKNGKGGLYEQFKLQRNEGQTEIAVKVRPSPKEVRDYGQISRLF